ncbi:MAG: hypothetical protein PHO08_09300 [Methylococcales bacterium]|nr:hypothetical protein [Methylococcales bacterium]MDD5631246.1 hypothetical protein [Methylococcales bacterium]
MIITSNRKILYGLVLIGIVAMITMPDVIIGLLFELAHLFFEVVFISFEWLETLLDHIVEHLLHTELHETQTIVFYLLLGIFAYPFYYLSKRLLRLFFRLKEALHAFNEKWPLYKAKARFYWQDLSLIEKIKVLVFTLGAIYLASFLVM